MTNQQLNMLDQKNRTNARSYNDNAEEGYSEAHIITMMIKKFPQFTDRRAGRRLLRSLRSNVTIKEFYDGIFEIVNKHMKSNEMDKYHPNFFNVMVEVHRHFKRCFHLDGELRAKYADKVLGIYKDYDLEGEDNDELY
jgi:hypothetical protein